jgi:hypothetical protein
MLSRSHLYRSYNRVRPIFKRSAYSCLSFTKAIATSNTCWGTCKYPYTALIWGKKLRFVVNAVTMNNGLLRHYYLGVRFTYVGNVKSASQVYQVTFGSIIAAHALCKLQVHRYRHLTLGGKGGRRYRAVPSHVRARKRDEDPLAGNEAVDGAASGAKSGSCRSISDNRIL